MSVRIITGDALAVLRTLPGESVQVCVTSPPYLGLRSYGTNPQTWGGDSGHDHAWGTVPSPGSRSSDTSPGPMQHAGNKHRERLTSDLCACGAWRGELGLEPTPALFIEHLVTIFREVRRVLRPDGLCFVNIGNSYSSNPGQDHSERGALANGSLSGKRTWAQTRSAGIKPKDLMLIPERFSIAMQDDGWWVRSCIVWAKTSAMPESVKDRPTSAWEPIWMFAKSRTYFYDQDAVAQPSLSVPPSGNGYKRPERLSVGGRGQDALWQVQPTAALRNVWTLGPEPSREAHYASFPTEIPKRCILAGSRKGDTVLDPFLGSGTTALVSSRLGRDCIGIELNPEYARMAEARIQRDAGTLFPEDVHVEPPAQPALFDVAG